MNGPAATRRFWFWAAGLLALAIVELPVMQLVHSLTGPVLQPWPALLDVSLHPVAGDVYWNLAIPFAGFIYALLWVFYLAATRFIVLPRLLAGLWLPAWLTFLALLVHLAVRDCGPWLVVLCQHLGLDASPAVVAPLNRLRAPLITWVEMPVVVLATVAWCYRRCLSEWSRGRQPAAGEW